MNDTDKILKVFEQMQADISSLKNGQDALRSDVTIIKTAVSEISHINTILKLLPPKGEVEEIVDPAKKEIKADILNLDAKVSRGFRRDELRIDNLEKEAGIQDPNKN